MKQVLLLVALVVAIADAHPGCSAGAKLESAFGVPLKAERLNNAPFSYSDVMLDASVENSTLGKRSYVTGSCNNKANGKGRAMVATGLELCVKQAEAAVKAIEANSSILAKFFKTEWKNPTHIKTLKDGYEAIAKECRGQARSQGKNKETEKAHRRQKRQKERTNEPKKNNDNSGPGTGNSKGNSSVDLRGNVAMVCGEEPRCGCSAASQIVACTYHGGDAVYLCDYFFKIPQEAKCGEGDVGSILVHELSHTLCNTVDRGYGMLSVKKSVANIDHAESWSLFAHAASKNCSESDIDNAKDGSGPSIEDNREKPKDWNSPIKNWEELENQYENQYEEDQKLFSGTDDSVGEQSTPEVTDQASNQPTPGQTDQASDQSISPKPIGGDRVTGGDNNGLEEESKTEGPAVDGTKTTTNALPESTGGVPARTTLNDVEDDGESLDPPMENNRDKKEIKPKDHGNREPSQDLSTDLEPKVELDEEQPKNDNFNPSETNVEKEKEGKKVENKKKIKKEDKKDYKKDDKKDDENDDENVTSDRTASRGQEQTEQSKAPIKTKLPKVPAKPVVPVQDEVTSDRTATRVQEQTKQPKVPVKTDQSEVPVQEGIEEVQGPKGFPQPGTVQDPNNKQNRVQDELNNDSTHANTGHRDNHAMSNGPVDEHAKSKTKTASIERPTGTHETGARPQYPQEAENSKPVPQPNEVQEPKQRPGHRPVVGNKDNIRPQVERPTQQPTQHQTPQRLPPVRKQPSTPSSDRNRMLAFGDDSTHATEDGHPAPSLPDRPQQNDPDADKAATSHSNFNMGPFVPASQNHDEAAAEAARDPRGHDAHAAGHGQDRPLAPNSHTSSSDFDRAPVVVASENHDQAMPVPLHGSQEEGARHVEHDVPAPVQAERPQQHQTEAVNSHMRSPNSDMVSAVAPSVEPEQMMPVPARSSGQHDARPAENVPLAPVPVEETFQARPPAAHLAGGPSEDSNVPVNAAPQSHPVGSTQHGAASNQNTDDFVPFEGFVKRRVLLRA